jgi:carboxypeptidase Taq
MRPDEATQELRERMKGIALLNTTAGLLSWDQEVHMPPAASAHRGAQLALLAGLIHERFTSPETGALIDSASSAELAANPLDDRAVNLREWRRSWSRARRLPRELVEEMALVTSQAQVAWVEARRASDFARFEPWLSRIVGLARREAEALGFEEHPYDALLEEYEPGLTVRELDALFPPLAASLHAILDGIQGSGNPPDTSFLSRPCPVAGQQALCRKVAEALGFDFTRGRLDVSVHPFTTGLGPGDTRITTRYDDRDLGNAFFSTLHEVGHGLYDQGLPEEHHGTPRGEAVSLGIHESQSRLWENLVGRSLPFWKWATPLLRGAFPGVFDDAGPEDLYRAVNAVRPSFIRTEADEVTYNLHIVLRYDLEKALISGSLKSSGVPDAWDAAFAGAFGKKPPDAASGCLQDVHWSHGSFGYFPTYTLGNLYAAQFMEAARRELPGLDGLLERGIFQPLRNWLGERVHSQGQRYRAGDLCSKVTGRPLSQAPFLAYLREKTGALYGPAGSPPSPPVDPARR